MSTVWIGNHSLSTLKMLEVNQNQREVADRNLDGLSQHEGEEIYDGYKGRKCGEEQSIVETT